MNTSYQGSKEVPHLLAWLKTHPYPHCTAATSLASLRSGVALAQILMDKLPKSYHSLFLPNIQIYNLTPQRSIVNLRVILDTLKTLCSQNSEIAFLLAEFTPEGLYFDHNMMQEFVVSVMKSLECLVPSVEPRKQLVQVQQMSEIANLSSIMAPLPEKVLELVNKKEIKKKEEGNQEELRIQKMCAWLQECHHVNVEELPPEEIMGELVNSVFAGSRLDRQKIVKQSHYQQGASSVFKKIGDYLLGCERMPKSNILALLDEIETGYMREQLFWNVIQDIMNIKVSHNQKMSRRKMSRKSRDRLKSQGESNKQNVTQHDANIPVQPVNNKPMVQTYECSAQVLKAAENWIKHDLGYEHSLLKSKSASKIRENPLLSGILLGSIIMRMQLGKVNINKEPKTKADVQRNMSEVTSCIIRRGLDAGRKFNKFKPSYSTYLGIIWEVKVEMEKKATLQKNRRLELAKEKKSMIKVVGQNDKENIIGWLKDRGYQFQTLKIVPVSLVTEVCGQILELHLLRETTKKIQENNLTKIIDELRRLGWEGQGGSSEVLSLQGNELRWSMLRFSYELINFKVYYCR